MTATTAQAAATAGVTVATIRTWCRVGAVAAVKTAGRWVIDAASLARRIGIGAARRTHRRTTVDLDLTSAYTYTDPWNGLPVTITPDIRTRARTGITTIKGLAPLLAEHLDAITDEGDRLHALMVLERSAITISAEPRDLMRPHCTRDAGRIATTYDGAKGLPVDVVLDLGERLRGQLARTS